MPTTRAAAKVKKEESNDHIDALKAELSEERAKRIAAENHLRTASLETERKIRILQKEVDLERSWRLSAQKNLKSLLLRIPSYHEQKNSVIDELEKNVEMDSAIEARGREALAETNIASLDSKTTIEILRREVQIERSWRTTCQENLNSLIKRLPFHFVEKSTINELKLPSEPDAARTMKEKLVVDTDKMNGNDLALSDFSEGNKEIERLKHLCSTLSEKNDYMKNAHESELAVYEEFRNWVESNNFCHCTRFREFRSEEIDQLLKDHQKKIGSGGYDIVYKAVLGNESVAIKILKSGDNQGSREFHTEVEILRKIHHPNIVHLVGACIDRKTLIYEYLGNGTLEDLLTEKTKTWFTWKPRIDVATKICSGLIFLHSIRPMPAVHGDLKPENIMFNSLNVPKIGDFGISHELNCITNTGTWEHITKGIPRGSSSYVDPEFTETCKLTPFADVYAFGVILLQLVTGEPSSGLIDLVQQKLTSLPNMKSKGEKLQKKILEKTGLVHSSLVDACDPTASLLILQLGLECTKKNSRQRPSLSASVWPKLCMIKLQCESSGAGP